VSEAPARAPALPHIVILAGGAGKRMKSEQPKLLHPVFFRPMIHYVLDAAMAIPHRSVSLVVGRGEREFREQCRGYAHVLVVRQETPLGTADAVRALEPVLLGQEGDALILNGDSVLLTARSLGELLAKHVESGAGCTVGRAASTDVDAGACCFRIRVLFDVLRKLIPGGPQKEFQLSDAAAALAAQGVATAEYRFSDPAETLDVNDYQGVWLVETILRERFNRELMQKGVALQDARTTLIDPRCRIDRDVRIESGCTVINSILESGVVLESFCRIADSEIGAGSVLRQGTSAEQARVGKECRVGPYARLRPGTRLDDSVWIGNFVEIKNATLGSGTRAAHLSFIGDAQIGRNVVIGCGFITCNSTGRPLKQRTVIEDDVFIGSASQAIAPVTLGAGSFIATGTSVTDDVPPDSFVISRGRQVTKPGYAKKYGKSKGPAAPR
jgi:bifunctional UDP-N-acetylglucosamine pyrophosphorylase/glucosamine-1-phosphate N-acetyltransferase